MGLYGVFNIIIYVKRHAYILMPYEKIYEELDKGRKYSKLPNLFNVSDEAMCTRLGITYLQMAGH